MKKTYYSFNDNKRHLALGLQERVAGVCEEGGNFYRNVKAFYKEGELELNLGKNNKGFFFFSFFQVDHGALKAGGW